MILRNTNLKLSSSIKTFIIILSFLSYVPFAGALNCKQALEGKTTLLSESNLLALEVISAGILASQLGSRGQKRLRENLLNPSSNAVIPSNSELSRDVYNSLINSLSVDVGNTSNDLPDFIQEGSIKQESLLLNYDKLRAYAGTQEGALVILQFVQENIEAIKVNAANIVLKRNKLFFNKYGSTTMIAFNGIPLAFALYVSIETWSDQWGEGLPFLIYLAASPIIFAASIVPTFVAAQIHNYRNQQRPVTAESPFDLNVGSLVRARFLE